MYLPRVSLVEIGVDPEQIGTISKSKVLVASITGVAPSGKESDLKEKLRDLFVGGSRPKPYDCGAYLLKYSVLDGLE